MTTMITVTHIHDHLHTGTIRGVRQDPEYGALIEVEWSNGETSEYQPELLEIIDACKA